MEKDITKDIVVVYHGKCPDGFSGAWVAWRKYGDHAEYVPYFHGEPLDAEIKNKDIIFIDVLPVESDLKRLISENKSVMAIDHHKTNEDRIKLITNYVFDLSKSGCVLAWEYFYPTEPIPKLLQYIQDMDIWQWKLDNSKEINAAIGLYDFNFSIWDDLTVDLSDSIKIKKHIIDGALIKKYEKQVIADIIEDNSQLVEFEGYRIYAVNSSVLSSQIGNILSIKKPPLAIIWQQRSDIITVGLRSNGTVDVGALAKKYGGGGHVGAAGFEIPLGQPFPWTVIENKNEK